MPTTLPGKKFLVTKPHIKERWPSLFKNCTDTNEEVEEVSTIRISHGVKYFLLP